MGIVSLIRKLFGADATAPPDATKLDGTTEAALARSLSPLPPHEQGWLTFAEARTLFSTKGDQYAFGELDRDGGKNIESFAAQHGPSSTLCRWRSGSISCAIQPQRMSALPPKADQHDCDVRFVLSAQSVDVHSVVWS
jgi:hypothetical protein